MVNSGQRNQGSWRCWHSDYPEVSQERDISSKRWIQRVDSKRLRNHWLVASPYALLHSYLLALLSLYNKQMSPGHVHCSVPGFHSHVSWGSILWEWRSSLFYRAALHCGCAMTLFSIAEFLGGFQSPVYVEDAIMGSYAHLSVCPAVPFTL